MRPSVFISVANKEFSKLRADVRDVLSGSFDVVVQPDFTAAGCDTIRKLDEKIAPCELLIHIVGRIPGSKANGLAITDFFEHFAQNSFLERWPRPKALLGDFSELTYFQWEPWLALHREIPVIVLAVESHQTDDFEQRDHLDNLRLARCDLDTLKSEAQRVGQITGIVFNHFGIVPPTVTQQIAPTRFARHGAGNATRDGALSFLGREAELSLLDDAWSGAETLNVFSVIAWGGVGKTALLTHWVQSRFANKAWKNAEGEPDPLFYFDWTFYDQGTRSTADDEGTKVGAASVGAFFEKALELFGDEDPNLPGKGARLAGLVQAYRSLLVLDGLEPLQYPPNHPQAGQITDPDLRDLLDILAMKNPGLCVISSRQVLSDLHAQSSTARQHDLEELPVEVAIRLLRKLQVSGSDADLTQAVEDYAGHALSLILLGRFLFLAKGGDIRKRDTIKLEKANEKRDQQSRNAWRVLEAYEEWLGSPEGNPEDLEALRLAGLFDRPASPDCLQALRAEPAIPGLTDRLVTLDDDDWNILLRRLHDAHLIQLRFPEEGDGAQPSLEALQVPMDVHPLIREYFAGQLREQQPEAFHTAHSRLFEHLCENTEHRPDTLEGLQPLYQAVAHGCLAGRQQEACDNVYYDRILRGANAFSTQKLGAIGADLAAVAAFFEQPWSRLSPNLSEADQAWLLNEAAFRLRALGRLSEALEPMRIGMEQRVELDDWVNAAISASNLSELEVTLGRLSEAVADGHRSIDFANRNNAHSTVYSNRAKTADALHQIGEREDAYTLFQEAENLVRKLDPLFGLLCSVAGFRCCDLLLAPAERAAWQQHSSEAFRRDTAATEAIAEAERRAIQTLEWGSLARVDLVGPALDHLTLARVAFYRASLDACRPCSENPHLTAAVNGIRDAGEVFHLPKSLLTSALQHHLTSDPEAAKRSLTEAQQIAERGPMPLYLADVHLHRARIFRDKAELIKARALIEKHGYWRRREELADAEEAAQHWS